MSVVGRVGGLGRVGRVGRVGRMGIMGIVGVVGIVGIVGIVGVVTTTVGSGFSQTVTGIQRAAWLQGCWVMTNATRSVEEAWTAPKAGAMIGVSRTIQNDKMTAYEFIVLREEGERLAYVAHPSGQPPATFLSTTVSGSELIFENPTHDFPQQIGYRLDGDALTAWIRGTQKGRDRRVEFPYRRSRCVSQ